MLTNPRYILLQIYIWLVTSIYGDEIDAAFVKCCKRVRTTRFVFRQVRIGGTVITGEIMHVKLNFGEGIRGTAAAVGGNYEVGTERFTVSAQDPDGTDVSDQFAVTNTGLEFEVTRTAGSSTEASGVVRIAADGDEDPDEEAPILGLLTFAYDAPNATSFEVSGTAFTPEPAPEA